MKAELASVEDQARNLTADERARLALKLIESLDPGEDEDAKELWLDEAQRRLADHDSRETVARPADDVLSEIEAKHK
ncbi:MAG: addiction module protein [Proteobacteria bacterium]|nr:addiction module protein [Pseudomonadota bacterium]